MLASIRRIRENQKYPASLYARSLLLLALREWEPTTTDQTSIRLKSHLKNAFQKKVPAVSGEKHVKRTSELPPDYS